MDDDALSHHIRRALLRWYDRCARTLPWRDPSATPWAVLVSEIMLQQTPVARVLPVYAAWLDALARRRRPWPPRPRPTRCGCGASSATRAGRCGCTSAPGASSPTTAARCPTDVAALLTPAGHRGLHRTGGRGVRLRAARAGRRHERAPGARPRRARPGRRPARRRRPATWPRCDALLPAAPATAARFSVALMEFGALVCTARAPRCDGCVLAAQCAWQQRGRPAYTGPTAKPQRFTGTDRQVRGRLLDVLRASAAPGHPGRSSTSPGPSRSSASGPWPACSPTAWSSTQEPGPLYGAARLLPRHLQLSAVTPRW